MNTRYRALKRRNAGPGGGGNDLHMIRDDAEASLCGIPRSSLTEGSTFDDMLCEDCLMWFDRRRSISTQQPKVKR
jgi:hypothetical protein